ncbi:hypothetical protein A9J41_00770 [Laribacter hongkongensis]|uniref:hypothetical protein n=1 Tax=Laribacter hongkongensis TaxID=168471 RepID=UPI001878BA31|nr:hypothetical protein [Laribacter hongkongensis]MBE5527449.1 hypothetical protein [Laribacter hongkongensis]
MPSSNIERFDEITAQLFSTLYQSFPAPVFLAAGNFVSPATQYSKVRGYDVASDEAEFWAACVIWLQEAGYIRYESHESLTASFWEVVLSPKGLEVLNSIPDSLSGKDTIGDQLVDAARTGATDLLKEGVKTALAKGVMLMGSAFS